MEVLFCNSSPSVEHELFGITKHTQAINSKRKGNKNELDVTKVLAEWTGHEFTRVPQSGGLRWANRVNICGDVISADPSFDFPFSVETKHVKSLGLEKSKPFLRKNSVVYTYMAQCKRDAAEVGKKPFLMLRENGMPANTYYIFLPCDLNKRVSLFNTGLGIVAQFMGQDGEVIGFKSELFFKQVPYEIFKPMYK
jgi:hypothetical protein